MTASRTGAMVIILALLAVLSTVLALAVAGESHTWDDATGFEGGEFDATAWDGDGGAVTMTGASTFWKDRTNPVVPKGSGGAWDDEGTMEPCVVFAKGQYYLYYTGYDGSDYAIGLARSDDGVTYSKYGSSARISKGGSYDSGGCRDPTVIFEGGLFKMWYAAKNGADYTIAYATSPDGLTWTKYGSNPVIDQPSSGWGSIEFEDPHVILVDGKYFMFLSGSDTLNEKMVGLATSKDGITWNIHAGNPLVDPATGTAFGRKEICDVAVVRDGALFRMYFTGRDTAGGKAKIGYGESFDGFSWTLRKTVYMDTGGTSTFDNDQLLSPGTIRRDDGVILMYYTGSDATDFEIGMASFMPWIVKANPPTNPVLDATEDYESVHLLDPSIVKSAAGGYLIYYGCYGGVSHPYSIAKAASTTATSWGYTSKYGSNPVLAPGAGGSWDDDRVGNPCVIYENGVYKMWYAGYDGSVWKIGYATSTDENTWTKYGSNPVLSGTSGKWDASGVKDPWVLRVGATYHMWYVGVTVSDGTFIGHATSDDGISWTKDSANPVLGPDSGSSWEKYYVENPCVLREYGRYVMYYGGTYQIGGKHRIGIATSPDGTTWTRDSRSPFMDWGNSSAWDDDGVSVGSVLAEGGHRYIYFQGYNGSSWRIGVASLSAPSATYTTPVLDASSLWPVEWGAVSWDADAPLGTTVRFQVATNQGGSVWRFVGPDGTDSTYFENPGQSVFWYQSGKYLRVRAYLTTDDIIAFVPAVRSITVTYSSRPGPFPPEVTVTSPNGGEDWMKTKTYPITWTARGNLNDTSVSLAYSTDNGTTWTDIATRQPNTGHYKWTVVNTETSGALVRVQAIDLDGRMASDTSDATFAIDPPAPKAGRFLAPADGDVLAPGPTSLTWQVEDPWGLATAPLTLEITTDGGITWAEVASRMPLSDGIQWDVPSLPASSDACQMRLSVLSWLGDVSIIESGVFTIDVSPPAPGPLEVQGELVLGRAVLVTVTVDDDMGVRSAVLQVSGVSGDRAVPMTQLEDGSWSVEYLPVDGDHALRVDASDGAHLASSADLEIQVAAAGTGTSPVPSLALELVAASAIAVVLVLVLALVVERRRGR